MIQMQTGSLVLRGFKPALPLTELIWLEGNGNYSLLHMKEGPAVMMAKTLARWQRMLPDFVRISRGALVNPRHVVDLRRISTYHVQITLTNGKVLPVARRRISQVFKIIQDTGKVS
ncbi:LytTR family DNA-binding domain-containing protein [Larkinella soli]|uniref:LytTR family DNA-binding domain-containing protein n=1 Tax=Larkinella soli TaxID=1770527 RepID=UPI0013E39834|nr:LytTR family DNA-binding domain-containing protein [Larkinella soli]